MGSPGHHADIWQPHFEQRTESFAIFSVLGHDFRSFDLWPELQDFNRWAAQLELRNSRGTPITFVKASPKPRGRARRDRQPMIPYEVRVDQGEVPTRLHNWHDFFNVLAWSLFPKTKAALNKRQILGGTGSRNFEQNHLAMFDEGGIFRLHFNDGSHRDLLFGHALCEGLVKGQTGLHGYLVTVDQPIASHAPAWGDMGWRELIARVDGWGGTAAEQGYFARSAAERGSQRDVVTVG